MKVIILLLCSVVPRKYARTLKNTREIVRMLFLFELKTPVFHSSLKSRPKCIVLSPCTYLWKLTDFDVWLPVHFVVRARFGPVGDIKTFHVSTFHNQFPLPLYYLIYFFRSFCFFCTKRPLQAETKRWRLEQTFYRLQR